jgi:hypothetical protein
MFKEQIDTVLSQSMDRKKFLQYAGTIFLGAIGVTGLVKLLLSSRESASSEATASSHTDQTSGYGGSNYGNK